MKTTCRFLTKYKGLEDKKICKRDYQPCSILKAHEGVIAGALRFGQSGSYFAFRAVDYTTCSMGQRK